MVINHLLTGMVLQAEIFPYPTLNFKFAFIETNLPLGQILLSKEIL